MEKGCQNRGRDRMGLGSSFCTLYRRSANNRDQAVSRDAEEHSTRNGRASAKTQLLGIRGQSFSYSRNSHSHNNPLTALVFETTRRDIANLFLSPEQFRHGDRLLSRDLRKMHIQVAVLPSVPFAGISSFFFRKDVI